MRTRIDRPLLRLLVSDRRPGSSGVVRLTTPGGRRPVTHLPLRPLRNGQEVCRQDGWLGPHQLVVRNQTPLDAVVAIVDPLRLASVHVATYVESTASATIASIPSGTYEVVFDLGESWNGIAFATSGQRAQFVDVLRFATPGSLSDVDADGYEAVLHANRAGAVGSRYAPGQSSLAP